MANSPKTLCQQTEPMRWARRLYARMCEPCLHGAHACEKPDCPCICNEPLTPGYRASLERRLLDMAAAK